MLLLYAFIALYPKFYRTWNLITYCLLLFSNCVFSYIGLCGICGPELYNNDNVRHLYKAQCQAHCRGPGVTHWLAVRQKAGWKHQWDREVEKPGMLSEICY